MAQRGVRRAPFWAAFQLAHWTVANWDYVSGKLLALRIDPAGLYADQLMDLSLSFIVDGGIGLTSTTELLTNLHRKLAEPPFALEELWGTTAEAQAGQEALMAMAGGAAPLRSDA